MVLGALKHVHTFVDLQWKCCTLPISHMKISLLVMRRTTHSVKTVVQSLLWPWRSFLKSEKLILIMPSGYLNPA